MATTTPTTIPQPLFPSDRATAPAALEDSSDTVWRQFEALSAAGAAGDAPGQAGGGERPAPVSPADEATVQQTLADESTLVMPFVPAAQPTARPASGVPEPGIDEVLALGRRNNRTAPRPAHWALLVKLLPAREQHGRRLPPPAALDGRGGPLNSPMHKRMRLRDQIEWAARTGALPAVHAFLQRLAEDEWEHF